MLLRNQVLKIKKAVRAVLPSQISENHNIRHSAPVLKNGCRSLESKNFGVCNAFSHTKLTYRNLALEKALSTLGLNASNTVKTGAIKSRATVCH